MSAIPLRPGWIGHAVLVGGLFCLGLGCTGGCMGARGMAYLFAPRQIQKPEYELSAQRVAILIDTARPGQANPVFETSLQTRIVELLRENEVPSQVIPQEDVLTLRSRPEYATWSIQRIGRELRADQVLYIRIDQLRLTDSRDPVVTPAVELDVKVIDPTQPAANARLWPEADQEPDGRRIRHQRQPVERENPLVMDAEARKLAWETGYYVARLFHEWDQEDPPPHQP